MKQKTMKLVFTASLYKHAALRSIRAKTDRLRIRIMCQSGAACLPVNCFPGDGISTMHIQLTVLVLNACTNGTS